MAENKSLYNTGPTYAIYLTGLFVEWLKAQGDMNYWNEMSIKKSNMIYDVIENSNGFYKNPIDKKYRSRMNVPFTIKNDNKELTQKFFNEAKENGLI